MDAELEHRKEVWLALSDLFLDTDVTYNYDYIVRVCSDSKYSLDELKSILDNEVAPVCSFNLFIVAGEWAGFDEVWLFNAIQRKSYKKNGVFRKILNKIRNPLIIGYIQEHWDVLAHKISENRKTL